MRLAAGLQFSSCLFPRSSHGFRIGMRKHFPGDRTGPNPARGRLSASRAALRCNRIQLDARRNRANQPGFLFCSQEDSCGDSRLGCPSLGEARRPRRYSNLGELPRRLLAVSGSARYGDSSARCRAPKGRAGPQDSAALVALQRLVEPIQWRYLSVLFSSTCESTLAQAANLARP